MSRKARASMQLEFRTLKKDEIEQRIDTLVGELAKDAGDRTAGNDVIRPCWISARELVRRMRPFMVLN